MGRGCVLFALTRVTEGPAIGVVLAGACWAALVEGLTAVVVALQLACLHALCGAIVSAVFDIAKGGAGVAALATELAVEASLVRGAGVGFAVRHTPGGAAALVCITTDVAQRPLAQLFSAAALDG